MKSKLFELLGMQYQPVCLLWADDKPEKAIQFKPGKWGCIMWLAANAAKGNISCCDRNTFGCFGGGVGVGFGNQYNNFVGGRECFDYFLSVGNNRWSKGKIAADTLKPYLQDDFHHSFTYGEGYLKSPDHVHRYVMNLPIVDIPSRYVVFKPLSGLESSGEKPETVIFFVDPDQLSALVILANYDRDDNDGVTVPYAAGCQTIGIYPYLEAKSVKPRAVIGLTDISARLYIKKQLPGNLMSFSVPFEMFEKMESDAEGSFLERPVWKALTMDKKKESGFCDTE